MSVQVNGEEYAVVGEGVGIERESPLNIEAAERGGLDFEELRRAFEKAGYSTSALAGLTEVERTGGRVDVAYALRRTAGGTPLENLVRLFVLGRPITRLAITDALPGVPLDALCASGLLKVVDGDTFQATMSILPFDDWFITHDRGVEDGSPQGKKDVVMGIGVSSIAVARMAVRRRGKSALDLGTGSGYLALTASPHVERVMATDLNPRALDFVRWNAKLNGVTNIETRWGSLFEPVHADRFDLILSNPPFAISPETSLQYRDSGLPGDTLSERALVGATERLTDGGFAVVTCSWHHASREDWHERPERWIEGKECDSWLICVETRDPLSYAANWLSKSESSEEEYGRRLDDWLEYYQEQGIGMISWGVAILRKRSSGVPWRRHDEMAVDWDVKSLADEVEGVFVAEDLLGGLDDEKLLDQPWRLSSRVVLDQQLRYQEGRWWLATARLGLEGGMRFPSNVDDHVREILTGCDGSHSFREVVRQFALRREFPEAELMGFGVKLARSMVSRGYLVLA